MNYPQIMCPLSPLPLKVGGHVPPAPMGMPPMGRVRLVPHKLKPRADVVCRF